MKTIIIAAILSVVSVATFAQSKRQRAPSPTERNLSAGREKVYTVPFTVSGFGSYSAKCDSAIARVNRSDIPMKDGAYIIGVINEMRIVFQRSYQQQSKPDTTGKK